MFIKEDNKILPQDRKALALKEDTYLDTIKNNNISKLIISGQHLLKTLENLGDNRNSLLGVDTLKLIYTNPNFVDSVKELNRLMIKKSFKDRSSLSKQVLDELKEHVIIEYDSINFLFPEKIILMDLEDGRKCVLLKSMDLSKRTIYIYNLIQSFRKQNTIGTKKNLTDI